MNPYLESPSIWRDFHQSLLYYCRALLRPQLPSGFVARLGERVVTLTSGNSFYADAAIVRPLPRRANNAEATTNEDVVPSARVATLPPRTEATAQPTPRLVRVQTEQIREPFLEIAWTRKQERVATVIEMLSPANKANGGEAHNEYVRKQERLMQSHTKMQSHTNLLEIDLLRRGRHTVAATETAIVEEFGAWDYLYCLHRVGERDTFHVHAWLLPDSLPTIPVPLGEELPDLLLDLTAAFNRAYNEAGYNDTIDYATETTPPLSPDDARWADALLREKGLR